MKTLFIGGIKSGKSYSAEQYTLALGSEAKTALSRYHRTA